jgi:hypothetical protein
MKQMNTLKISWDNYAKSRVKEKYFRINRVAQ